MVDKAREIALKVLYDIDKNGAYSNISLDNYLNNNRKRLTEKDIGFISEIVYGVTSWELTLDEIIKKHSNVKIKKISPWILNILRMSVYQIIFLNKIPKSAAVNESVELAKKYGHKASSAFVNAVLRNVEKNDYEEFFNITNNVEKISKTTSMPEWIICELLKNKDIEVVENICNNLIKKSHITIRINTLKTNKEQLQKLFDEKRIKYINTKFDDFLILIGTKNISNNDLFKKGLYTVQDISAGLTVNVLNPKENECVLDVCAAPGGKTTYIAEKMNNKGYIEAWDIYEHKLKLIQDNSNRLGIDIIKTNLQDATVFKDEYKNKFDKILLDVPCMGIGVIKRKPDIKWKRKPEDILEITKIQKQILINCSKYLKSGGELVYSTCSLFKEENENLVNDFVKNNLEFQIIHNQLYQELFDEQYEKKFISSNDCKYIELMPNDYKDGFFICKIYKKLQEI